MIQWCFYQRQYVELEPSFSVKQSFKSGQDALSWLSREEADLIILDYYMPLMTGKEFIDRLHSMGKAPSVIMVTSASDSAIVHGSALPRRAGLSG